MRDSIINKLICPDCKASGLLLQNAKQGQLEITDAKLMCGSCRASYPVTRGIIDFLPRPSETVSSEIAGWKKYHTPQRNPEQFKDQWLLKLPRLDASVSPDPESIEAWNQHADNFDLALKQLNLVGNEEVLELGAGRCWASAAFARLGCKVTALDVVRDKYIGLESAEVYLTEKLFFERILADMERLPFADKSFDLVFSTATVHHSPDLDQLCAEAGRVLKPGGRFVAINDTVSGLFDYGQDLEEIELGINEHAYPINRYKQAMKRAGLKPKLFLSETWRKQLETSSRDLRNPLKIIGFKISSFFWQSRYFKGLMEYFLVNWAQLIWGIGLHTIAVKRSRK
ncbi:MAG: hypothetical protein A2509_10620 [Candidatus Edwardsbacteria bacterium RIFOXYD12_FULL_50_11]|uniref:Methyltransferase type 11 domain-containing protein n=1 Tax=Candidatus Edwardsbacteria bacterium GWF2_54_11 TaxID=1817851 RepID=A0A1F5RG71_9BACT|nr:MAG: hypothetical protein A2502_09325 [Candidatus Edwardsbacteria bacterium RifOxyC12_full_54_24]OGF07217.1 MAG: hypothetical protein A2273_01730 [Candidatus Edwardsbacteria bacterium RifOxyA12_full_54_48]OGF09472.1 MAG: hypothetical protein A3K15_08140 [Candidatus Edwardsbacteria bacterium GWE2_54_12]OGF13402.1 MAG: hypothetical protein A2024_05305 [Candidatus Edwardsbacteria bacterium GWF2_54_11]OGF17262.1 MAG: hypothetical protein A2509_10620 [Candidatus Edwardsbacteria bacterium RIFOXYD1